MFDLSRKDNVAPMALGWHRHFKISKDLLHFFWNLWQGKGSPETILLSSLGSLKGPFMKCIQIACVVPDLLPPSYVEALKALQAHAPAMGWPFVKRRLQAELGPTWFQHFSLFDQQASFAASLGQVHKAILQDGQHVACKIQYPGMEKALYTDLQSFSLACAIYQRYGKAICTKALQEEMKERLLQEIDYRQEAEHIRWFSIALAQESFVQLPKCFHSLSTDRLLTMSWLEGRPFEEAFALPQADQNLLGRNLFLAWYKPFYHYGILHCDPHFGNYTWTKDHLNIVDFGCVRVFSPHFIQSVLSLYYALEKNDSEAAIEAYRSWGFANLDHELIDILNLWAKFLYGPLLQDKITCIDHNGVRGKHIAAQVHALLRKKGAISPPKEFLMMDRVSVSIGSALIRLRAQQNWHRLFHCLIDGWSVTETQHRQMSLQGSKRKRSTLS